MTPRRILHFVGSMNRGGAETFIMNVYRNLDRSQFQFDFLVSSPKRGAFDAEIEALGGRIFRLPFPKPAGVPVYLRKLQGLIKAHGPYAAVHSHTQFFSGLVMGVARWQGIAQRIAHSHSTGDGMAHTWKRQLYRSVMRQCILQHATHLVGCCHAAGDFLFGPAISAPRTPVHIVKNGIEVQRYFSDADASAIRAELGIPLHGPVFAHVGRFEKPKNHTFLLKIFAAIADIHPTAQLVLAGNGSLRAAIEMDIQQLGIANRVHLLGVRHDIQRLFAAFDVLLMPSLYEGLPLTILEAQAAGVPSLISDTISREVDAGLQLTHSLSLNEPPATWASHALKLIHAPRVHAAVRLSALRQHGYDAAAAVQALTEVYRSAAA